jgi:hypothetical protein
MAGAGEFWGGTEMRGMLQSLIHCMGQMPKAATDITIMATKEARTNE